MKTKKLSVQKKEMRGQAFSQDAYYTDGTPQPEYYDDLVKSYGSHIWVYACVKAIATNIAGLPVEGFRKDSEGNWVDYPNNDLLKVLLKPNPYFSTRDLLAFTSISIDLCGNAYWGLEKNKAGKIFEVYPLPPGSVKVKGSKDKMIDHYIYSINGKDIVYQPDELIQFKEPNPEDQLYGLGSVTPAKMSISTDFFAQTYNKMFFKNNARPDAVLESDQNLDDATAKRILASWKAAQEGVEKRGKTALMSNGVKYKEINRTPKDIDFVEGRKVNREEILASFGVPPVVVGIFEYANYANSKEQIQIFWKHTILPRVCLIEGALTRWSQTYLKDLETSIELVTDNVESLRVDENQRAVTAKTYVEIGIPLNQVIDALELPFEPVDGGDESRPGNLNPGLNQGAGGAPTPPPSKGTKSVPSDVAIPINPIKEMAWKSYDSKLNEHENATRMAMRSFFKGQRRRVMSALAEHGEKLLAGRISKSIKSDDSSLAINMIFDSEKEMSRMEVPAGRTIKGTYYDFAVSTSRKLKPGFDFDLGNALAEAWIAEKKLKLVRQATAYTEEQITQAVVDGVQDALAEGFTMGESIAGITDRIDEVFQFAQEGRSERIARTETTSAANAGAEEGMKAAGAEAKEWLATRDSKTRDTHADLDGQQVPIDQSFVTTAGNQLDYPGDPSAPPEEVINCRCTLLPVTDAKSMRSGAPTVKSEGSVPSSFEPIRMPVYTIGR